MKWVKDPPTKDGYYWILPELDLHTQGPMVVEVEIDTEDMGGTGEIYLWEPGGDNGLSIPNWEERNAPIRFWSDYPLHPPSSGAEFWRSRSPSPSSSVSWSESVSWSVSISPSASPSPADEDEQELIHGEVPMMREI